MFRGYKELTAELVVARRSQDYQERRARSASVERAPPASYYKSVVGTRSVLLSSSYLLLALYSSK